VFYRNVAVSGMNMDYESAMGGGIAAFESSPVVERCSFFGNVAEKYYENFPGHGAGLFLNNSPAILQNCIVAFNYGAEGFECVSCTEPPDTSDLLCCDIYGNELGDWVGSIADQFGQNGNISGNPLFCDTVVANLFLETASPCAAANSPCAGTIGAFDVGCTTDAEDDNQSPRPRAFTLSQNSPNPFNTVTVISFGLAATADVRLILYDVLGHPVRRLVGGVFPAGLHRVAWDGRDDSGDEVASGVYLYSLQVDGLGQTRKMIFIK
jgi:hypothetical protein